ncbi:glycosyltransferase [Marinobacter sp. SS21]|uniref:glycosyltransferase n=1 Tax=Marinobacter sp. SS21 TaxID=2979460 RepID=UPI00232D50F9|nr:glycosyltransferase [Marinobacter sp. SS21]MDC0661787.1 glycosyltransferase [Marinobacter sp. SS21]
MDSYKINDHRKDYFDPRKVSFILPSLDIGGAEKVCVKLSEEFQARGIHTEILLIVPSIKLPVLSGVRVRSIGGSKHFPLFLNAFISVCYLAFRFNLRSKREVFISSVRGASIAALFADFLSFKKSGLIVREASLFFPKYWYGKRLHSFVVKYCYSRAKVILAVSETVKEELVESFGCKSKILVINNPIDILQLKDKAKEFTPKSRFDFNFLTVGRLVAEKSYEDLLIAFSKLESNKNFGLTIIGDGQLNFSLKSLADRLGVANKICWLGYQDNPYPWFKTADAFVLTSKSEGFVNVLAEAVALDVPAIISTDCGGGPQELLKGQEQTHIVPVGDIDEISRALNKVLSESVRRIKRNTSEFESSKVIDAYLEAIF